MLINKKQTMITYRCPHCGNFVKSMVGVFSLNAQMLNLKCPCGESKLTIEYTKSRKINIKVPCFVCHTDHLMTIDQESFFEKDKIAFGCPYSSLDLCFVGRESSIDKLISEANTTLESMLEGHEISELFAQDTNNDITKTEDELFFEEENLNLIFYVLKDLEESHSIKCKCKDEDKVDGQYKIQLKEGSTKANVICSVCGASKEIDINSSANTNQFLECTELELK